MPESLSYKHRREHVECIGEARRAESRARRVGETVGRVGRGRSAP